MENDKNRSKVLSLAERMKALNPEETTKAVDSLAEACIKANRPTDALIAIKLGASEKVIDLVAMYCAQKGMLPETLEAVSEAGRIISVEEINELTKAIGSQRRIR